MPEIDFMSVLHKSTKRDYLARVNDSEFPKHKASSLAKKFDFDYWDGDRRICYGGSLFRGTLGKSRRMMTQHYNLPKDPKILDIGCGKGFCSMTFSK